MLTKQDKRKQRALQILRPFYTDAVCSEYGVTPEDSSYDMLFSIVRDRVAAYLYATRAMSYHHICSYEFPIKKELLQLEDLIHSGELNYKAVRAYFQTPNASNLIKELNSYERGSQKNASYIVWTTEGFVRVVKNALDQYVWSFTSQNHASVFDNFNNRDMTLEIICKLASERGIELKDARLVSVKSPFLHRKAFN